MRCASLQRVNRRLELEALGLGEGGWWTGCFTQSHGPAHALAGEVELHERLARELSRCFSLRGYRVSEVTRGASGWHVHTHLVWLPGADPVGDWSAMRDAWFTVLDLRGREALALYNRAEPVRGSIGRYLAGEAPPPVQELSDKSGVRSLHDVAHAAAQSDAAAFGLWREWERASVRWRRFAILGFSPAERRRAESVAAARAVAYRLLRRTSYEWESGPPQGLDATALAAVL